MGGMEVMVVRVAAKIITYISPELFLGFRLIHHVSDHIMGTMSMGYALLESISKC